MAKRSGLPERAMRRTSSRFMSGEQVAAIIAIIRSWPQLPITWEHIREQVGRELFKAGPRAKGKDAVWSRQSLSANPDIKKAYDERRATLLDEAKRGGKRRQRSRDPAIVVVERQVERLQGENAELREQLAAYEAKFRKMVMNLHRGETTEEGLDNPLPERVERRQRDN
jgi:hypothetical protein